MITSRLFRANHPSRVVVHLTPCGRTLLVDLLHHAAHSAADRALCWPIPAPIRLWSYNPVCSLDRPSHCYQDLFQYRPHLFGFAGGLETKIPNPMKALRQNVLHHPTNDHQGRLLFLVPLAWLMIAVLLADPLSIIAHDPPE
jgi:hypothetical protein